MALHFPDPQIENPWVSPTGVSYFHDGVKWAAEVGVTDTTPNTIDSFLVKSTEDAVGTDYTLTQWGNISIRGTTVDKLVVSSSEIRLFSKYRELNEGDTNDLDINIATVDFTLTANDSGWILSSADTSALRTILQAAGDGNNVSVSFPSDTSYQTGTWTSELNGTEVWTDEGYKWDSYIKDSGALDTILVHTGDKLYLRVTSGASGNLIVKVPDSSTSKINDTIELFCDDGDYDVLVNCAYDAADNGSTPSIVNRVTGTDFATDVDNSGYAFKGYLRLIFDGTAWVTDYSEGGGVDSTQPLTVDNDLQLGGTGALGLPIELGRPTTYGSRVIGAQGDISLFGDFVDIGLIPNDADISTRFGAIDLPNSISAVIATNIAKDSSGNTDVSATLQADSNTGSQANVIVEDFSDNESRIELEATGHIGLSMQTADMVDAGDWVGQSDRYIATKKYVDDSSTPSTSEYIQISNASGGASVNTVPGGYNVVATTGGFPSRANSIEVTTKNTPTGYAFELKDIYTVGQIIYVGYASGDLDENIGNTNAPNAKAGVTFEQTALNVWSVTIEDWTGNASSSSTLNLTENLYAVQFTVAIRDISGGVEINLYRDGSATAILSHSISDVTSGRDITSMKNQYIEFTYHTESAVVHLPTGHFLTAITGVEHFSVKTWDLSDNVVIGDIQIGETVFDLGGVDHTANLQYTTPHSTVEYGNVIVEEDAQEMTIYDTMFIDTDNTTDGDFFTWNSGLQARDAFIASGVQSSYSKALGTDVTMARLFANSSATAKIEVVADSTGGSRATIDVSKRAEISTQTSAMTGGTSDNYIATKKYVDDNAGGGLETWTPTLDELTVFIDESDLAFVGAVTANITQNGNVTEITPITTGMSTMYSASTETATLSYGNTVGLYCDITLPTTITESNNEEVAFYLYNDIVSPTIGIPLLILGTDGAGNFQFRNSMLNQDIGNVYTRADIEGSEWCASLTLNSSTSADFSIYDDGVLNATFNLNPSLANVDAGYVYHVIGGVGASGSDVLDGAQLDHKLSPTSPVSGVSIINSGHSIDTLSYPMGRADKAYIITGTDVTTTLPFDSELGLVQEGTIFTFDSSSAAATKTTIDSGIDTAQDYTWSGENTFTDLLNVDKLYDTIEIDSNDTSDLEWGHSYILRDPTASFTSSATIYSPLTTTGHGDRIHIIDIILTASPSNWNQSFYTSGGGNWFVNGVDSGSTNFTLVHDTQYRMMVLDDVWYVFGGATGASLSWNKVDSSQALVSGGHYYTVNQSAGSSYTLTVPSTVDDDFAPITVVVNSASDQVTFTRSGSNFRLPDGSTVTSFESEEQSVITLTTDGSGSNIIDVIGYHDGLDNMRIKHMTGNFTAEEGIHYYTAEQRTNTTVTLPTYVGNRKPIRLTFGDVINTTVSSVSAIYDRNGNLVSPITVSDNDDLYFYADITNSRWIVDGLPTHSIGDATTNIEANIANDKIIIKPDATNGEVEVTGTADGVLLTTTATSGDILVNDNTHVMVSPIATESYVDNDRYNYTNYFDVGFGSLVDSQTILKLDYKTLIVGGGKYIGTWRKDGYKSFVQIGSDFNISDAGTTGQTKLTVLSESEQSIAVLYQSTFGGWLRKYTHDGDGTWTKVGNDYTAEMFGGETNIQGIYDNRIVIINISTDELQTFEFDGTDWSKVGTALPVAHSNGSMCLYSTSPTVHSIVLASTSAGGLQMYDYTVATGLWSTFGSLLPLSGLNNSSLTMVKTPSGFDNSIVLIDGGNDKLQRYIWGSGFELQEEQDISSLSIDSVTSLSGYDLLMSVYSTNDIRMYNFGKRALSLDDSVLKNYRSHDSIDLYARMGLNINSTYTSFNADIGTHSYIGSSENDVTLYTAGHHLSVSSDTSLNVSAPTLTVGNASYDTTILSPVIENTNYNSDYTNNTGLLHTASNTSATHLTQVGDSGFGAFGALSDLVTPYDSDIMFYADDTTDNRRVICRVRGETSTNGITAHFSATADMSVGGGEVNIRTENGDQSAINNAIELTDSGTGTGAIDIYSNVGDVTVKSNNDDLILQALNGSIKHSNHAYGNTIGGTKTLLSTDDISVDREIGGQYSSVYSGYGQNMLGVWDAYVDVCSLDTVTLINTEIGFVNGFRDDTNNVFNLTRNNLTKSSGEIYLEQKQELYTSLTSGFDLIAKYDSLNEKGTYEITPDLFTATGTHDIVETVSTSQTPVSSDSGKSYVVGTASLTFTLDLSTLDDGFNITIVSTIAAPILTITVTNGSLLHKSSHTTIEAAAGAEITLKKINSSQLLMTGDTV